MDSIREVISDVECLSDLLGRFPLDHIRDGFASGVKKRFDVQIVSSLKKVSV